MPVAIWIALSCLGFWGGEQVQSKVNEYSLVWWITGAIRVASFPGILALGAITLYLAFCLSVIALVVSAVVLVIYLLFRLIQYFINNPW